MRARLAPQLIFAACAGSSHCLEKVENDLHS
jgi:hypothetical protein